MFQPVEKSRAYERVVEQIEAAIYRGDIRPGEHLPSERALVDQFQVGRSTVREALRILESMGLVKTQPGSPRGPQVTPSNVRGLARMLNGAIRVEQISLVDLVQYRMVSGSAANFLAAHLRTEDHLSRMTQAISKMADADVDDVEGFSQADADFHEAVRDAAGNAFLDVVGSVINQVIIDLVASTIENATNTANLRADFIDLHRQIFAAIESHNGDKAAELAKSSLYAIYGPLLDKDDQHRLKLLL
ncbi:GntR family transcriptional regulator [Saxibacter everestensis]|uniref:GntR family transcriptional regulator n=1 Tax=Saxibacter everestensis TaxID=2909229 RepID=A0ABY8QRM8_9MICO|nr:GntR family transcriptional regulator [Brevibacteriaceae bacterium ZFBP1038]